MYTSVIKFSSKINNLFVDLDYLVTMIPLLLIPTIKCDRPYYNKPAGTFVFRVRSLITGDVWQQLYHLWPADQAF